MIDMTDKKKMRVGVVFGGRSGEHEVSLRSANSIIQALDKTKYEVVPIGIEKNGRWLTGPALLATQSESLSDDDGHVVVLHPAPQEQHSLVPVEADVAVEMLDVVFPIVHGTYGEDGTLQGLFELADIPYVGAGVVGSAVGMDKAMFKYVMAANGIPQLPWELVLSSAVRDDMAKVIVKLETALAYPMFVKPANLGSSVGISKCDDAAELEAGLLEAAQYDRRLVVEQGATVRELEVSVLGNEAPIASVVGEIRPERDFYDYEAKYVTDDSELLIPAPIAPELSERIRALAVETYAAVDCAGLARVDFLLDINDGEIYINEVNTLPGFTSISMYPKLWEASGLSYAELLDRLLVLAVERHEEKRALKRDFG